MKIMPGRKFTVLLFCAVLLALLLGLFLYPRLKRRQDEFKKKRACWLSLEQEIKKEARRFSGRSGIVVKCLDTNWQIAFNNEQPFPSASLVKIPIMAAVFKAAQEGRINLAARLRLKASDKTSGSGELKNMPAGSRFTVEELVRLMIGSSDNTATNMLIELLGFSYLNRSFKEFGMEHTNLARKMMDFGKRKNGVENYTTAADMAYLLERIYIGKLCSRPVSQRCMELLKQQKSRDRIPAQLPRGTIAAHKTGLESRVCHDAGVVFAPRGDFLICVLTKGVANSRVAKKFISNVALEVYNNYNEDSLN